MTTKYFKCTLLTDVVLNASLATEGNMQSLDFIPGSNFLGIVAAKLYKEISTNVALDVFHSEKVLFGDALISKDNKISYALPFSLFQDKLKSKIAEDDVWVHHGIEKYPENIQLKQNRKGYLNTEKIFIKEVEKRFLLKSAYNANERRSAEGKMFGFDSIKKGQEFIFSVVFNDETYIEKVEEALTGVKKLGKSKTAQYGQVKIEAIADNQDIFESKSNINNKLVVYAESRLCFLNEYGNPTFQPKPSDFGINAKDFDWKYCQIRTGAYSQWNAKRNTPDSQRSFIERGSVFVIENPGNIDATKLPEIVGEYQNEGFGRVIYNPKFLEFDKSGIWEFKWEIKTPKEDEDKKETLTINERIESLEKLKLNSVIGDFVKSKAIEDFKDLRIGEKILEVFKYEEDHKAVLLDAKIKKDKSGKEVKEYYITKSQWGNIRSLATQAKDIDELNEKLFGSANSGKITSFRIDNDELFKKDKIAFYKKMFDDLINRVLTSAKKDENNGFLMHGVADEKIWGKKNGERRKALAKIIEENRELGTQFVAKFAAEIAKKN